MDALGNALQDLLGLDAIRLTWWNMLVRAIIVYISALAMVRLGEKRFLGQSAAFDAILGIILGSTISGAITGSSEFLPTLIGALTLVGLHWLFAALAFRSDRFSGIVKGSPRALVRDGQIDWDAMRRSSVSRTDLMGQLRLRAQINDLDRVQVARFERSGDISVIEADPPPKVLDIQVQDGVQTVRIRLE